MQRNETHTENWGAYFSGYDGISISFIDLITNQTVAIIYTNETANFTTGYLNITSFLNVANVNTTFQSFDTQYYTVMLVEAFNAYGSVGQYFNFNINYTYVPPQEDFVEVCISEGVICIFPDYTTQTQRQMDTYMIFAILISIILISFASYKMINEVGVIAVVVSLIVIVIELIYFIKIQYLPINYVVWATLGLLLSLYILYRLVTK
jgi:hypothetical protein